MSHSNRNILLFNPCIYDFAAYDFWNKPYGLLSIGALLRKYGFNIHLVDCLDRHHPELLHFLNLQQARTKKDGTGKFYRQEIEKPNILKEIPRKYCQYGMPQEVVRTLLQKVPPPLAILVTSFMTYWYPAVRDAVSLLRQVYPGVPILLGGTYATLLPEHARRIVEPDYLVVGEGENQVLNILSQISEDQLDPIDTHILDNLPFPAFDLYPALQSVAIMTSRGCPYRCSFCASSQLVDRYRRRSPEHVLTEMALWHEEFGVQHFAFFDDALFHRAEKYWKPLLRAIIDRRWPIQMHTPNGVQIKLLDEEMAFLMKEAGVRTIRLSFESSNPARQVWMSHKVSNKDLERALNHLERAGYQRHEIGVYVLMGLPDQDMAEVKESVRYVCDLGARVNLASFSPIPKTIEWERAIQAGYSFPDPLLTNNSIFPIWSKKYGHAACQELVLWTKEQNLQLV